ncbi:MAG: NADP-dependent isocitrate dehydrogenase [Bacteroidetes bacterium]|nr:NADP-dependent isocitrate dehydrogenase [Bacteroidota bacterium]
MTTSTKSLPKSKITKRSFSATPITVAYGDGIGPEIMGATLKILNAAGAKLDIEEIEIGERVYLGGNSSGIRNEAWDSLRRTKVFLKAPITTPQGGGFKSLNVTTRKVLGLYANVRPCVSYHPYIHTKHPIMDVVIVRENEEDLYGGIEHQQTDEVVQCLKLISKPGTEKIVRYAFEYARAYGRKKVTCFTKDNIMKMTDGLFHKTFDRIGEEYPDLEKEHWIVDIGAAKLAETPEIFDVIVMPNLYGDILSDVAAQITGSVGLAGSANIGEGFAMFEAIHGSAPDIAGANKANPSGLLLAAIQMLVHIKQSDIAEKIHNAWLRTIEDGIHTEDIYNSGVSKEIVGTKEFAEAVITRLGMLPQKFKQVDYGDGNKDFNIRISEVKPALRELIGVDVFLQFKDRNPENLASLLSDVESYGMKLTMITNRGTKVWPNGFPETFCTDHWRCRFARDLQQGVNYQVVIDLLQKIHHRKLEIIKTENLYVIDGQQSFSAGQGQ